MFVGKKECSIGRLGRGNMEDSTRMGRFLIWDTWIFKILKDSIFILNNDDKYINYKINYNNNQELIRYLLIDLQEIILMKYFLYMSIISKNF